MAALTLALLAFLAGCLQSPLVPCGDTVCPEGNVCTAGGCATPADVRTCAGLDEGAACQAAAGGNGTCAGGACQTGLCGNGEVDIGELCDDGNQSSGDGCRADCTKVELCGDGALDDGEACDDGNQNAADGCDACLISVWNARAIVGSATVATTSALANPHAVAIDGLGRTYVADTENHRIRRIELDGSVTTLAGTGTPGFSGDGGQATSAQLQAPNGVAVDGLGRVFVTDTANQRIRRVDLDGTISTIAGTGISGVSGDGGPAILAQIAGPIGVTVDGLGRVFIADTENHRIRRIDIDGSITTVAGTGTDGFGGDGGPATSAALSSPYGVAIDPDGRIVIADTSNDRIRAVAIDGTIETIAGTGTNGFSGDGGPATAARLSVPVSVAVDAAGLVYVVDALNQRVRRVALDGTISTIAGTGVAGYAGDGGPATAAQLANPLGVGVDGSGRVAIADASNQRVRLIDATGMIGTVAGNGTFGFGGDGGAATSTQLATPSGVATDAMGRIYFADAPKHRIRRVELDGTITSVAGTGELGFAGDGGLATRALLRGPLGVAVDPAGRVLIVDSFNNRIRRVELDGTITTIAGTGAAGFGGDGGPATSAQLAVPTNLAIDALGRVLIADTNNRRIRQIELDGTISTIAGTGGFGYNGDGIQASAATLAFPYGVAIDAQDRVVIGDTGNHRIRRIALDGTISTIAGVGTSGFGGDGGPATAALLNGPNGVAIDPQGRIVFSEIHRVRQLELDGTITTLAGTGVSDDSGDAAAATAAPFSDPQSVAIDPMGRVLVADANNHRIRRFTRGGTISTVAGQIDPDHIGPVASARLADPQALVLTAGLTLVAGGTSGTLEAVRGGRVEVIAGRYPQSVATGALARFRTRGFGAVGGVAIDPTTGAIYLSESTANRIHVITQVDPAEPATWTISTLANASGAAGFTDGSAATAQFRSPAGLFLDVDARLLYVADTGNHAIRAIDLTAGSVSTVVNTGHQLGFAGDGGPATNALLYRPTAVTRCPGGDLFIADTSNNRVRRVAPTGEITTVLGDGVAASSGEGRPAHTFPVDTPRGLACDAAGNLFVSSATTVRLLPATDDGHVDGTGEVQTIYGSPPRASFPTSVTSCLSGLAIAGPSTVQVADACTGLLVELERATLP